VNDVSRSTGEIQSGTSGAPSVGGFDSFEDLVRAYQPYAYSLALKFLCDEDEAMDAVQEVFVRVWKHLDRYDRNKKFTTWLYTIVSNVCVDRFRSLSTARSLFRSREGNQFLEDLPDETDWVTLQARGEIVEIINMLARGLSKKQRLVFTLRDLQDLSVDEVVEITGLSVGSVKTNLHYARAWIRNMLIRRYGVKGEDL
jgi:RNA polymerase sigma-70 factor (ECF subfamily)